MYGLNMQDNRKNFEYGDIVTIDGQQYQQIMCTTQYYDFYSKREILKGERGGYCHISYVADNNNWIDKDFIVGAIITEYATITQETKQDINYSPMSEYFDLMKKMSAFWEFKCGVSEPSLINAIMYNSRRIIDFMKEIVRLESLYIEQKHNINDVEQIMLWVMFGAIQEAVLKIHFTIFREKYNNVFDLQKFDNIRVQVLINELKKDNVVSLEETGVLNTINSNRNMIHFLSNKPLHSYERYCYCVEDGFEIYKKLFELQKIKVN